MFKVLNGSEQQGNLCYRENIGQSKFFSRVELVRYQIGYWQYMPEKEATTLSSHSALVTPYLMFNFDKVEVSDDVLLRELSRRNVVVVGEYKPHFLGITAQRSGRVSLCR